MMDAPQIGILFVCMGNICRSPLAECLFRHHAAQAGLLKHFDIDSAGTGGWHAGAPPDPRMRAAAAANGVHIDGAARQVRREDFDRFDHIVCMDDDNHALLLERGAPPDRVTLLMSHHPDPPMPVVPDPYYGGDDGFQLVYRLVDEATRALLESLAERHALKPITSDEY
jgi:protein-tyrosine phosphatase